jgi:hypothetical protein
MTFWSIEDLVIATVVPKFLAHSTFKINLYCTQYEPRQYEAPPTEFSNTKLGCC